MIKLEDPVYCNNRELSGQIKKIRHNLVTILFVTGDRVVKKINEITYVNNQWRIND